VYIAFEAIERFFALTHHGANQIFQPHRLPIILCFLAPVLNAFLVFDGRDQLFPSSGI